MASALISYYWRLASFSFALPFRIFGYQISAGCWLRYTKEFHTPSPVDVSSSRFQYSPLDHERDIRVFTLHPGSGKDPLVGTLETVSLDSIPEYTALSYVWGDQTKDRGTIAFPSQRGQFLPIGANLKDALLALRHSKHAQSLWVDALCIDQSNAAERVAQVQLMAEIYTLAASVDVWLGPPTRHTPLGLETLAYLAGAAAFDDGAPWNRLPGGEVRAALEDVVARPYFGRLWVVQEAALARRVVLRVGRHALAWAGRPATRRFLARVKLAELAPAWLQSPALRRLDLRPLCELLEQSLAADARRRRCGGGGSVPKDDVDDDDDAPSLLDIVHAVRHRHVTDPRDRIYAVMSLATPARIAGFVLDYSLSWEETYSRFFDMAQEQVCRHPETTLEDM